MWFLKGTVPLVVASMSVSVYSCGEEPGDDDDATVSPTVTAEPQPPVIDPVGEERALNDNVYVLEGEELTLTMTAYDPNGDTLTWTATDVPRWAEFDEETATLTGTAPYWEEDDDTRATQQGKFDVTFDVSDSTFTTRKIVTIHLIDSQWPDKTIAELVAERPIVEGQLGTPVDITITSDTVVNAPLDGTPVRWIEFSFTSQVPDVEGWEDDWVSDVNYACLPLDEPSAPNAGAIVEGSYSTSFGDAYLTQQTCADLGIPVLIIDRGWDFDKPGNLMTQYDQEAVRQRDPHYLFYVWVAAHYLRAADALGTVIETMTSWNFSRQDFRVMITGHSKMGHSAITAAAAAPGRVAGFMGSGCAALDTDAGRLLGDIQGATSTKPECSTTYMGAIMRHFVDTLRLQDQMAPDTLAFLAEGTNDANGDPEGYSPKYVLGVSTDQLEVPHRVGAIPNEVHTTANDLDFAYWKMWIAHAFLDRPVPEVREVTHTLNDSDFTISATIVSDIELNQVRVWATNQNDMDHSVWNGFESYPMTLEGDTWVTTIPSDSTAYFVEVVDVEGGVVSSAPVPTNEDYPLLNTSQVL